MTADVKSEKRQQGLRSHNQIRLSGKVLWTLPAVLLVLIALRVALPFFVTSYVNDSLSRIPGYRGYVDDIDMSLWRGAYGWKNCSLCCAR